MYWLIVFRWLKFNFHNFPETGWWLNNTCSASLSSFLKIDFYSTTGTNKTAWLRIIFSIWKFSHSVSWKVFKFQVSWYFSNNLWNYRISFLKTNWVVTDHWPYEWFCAPGNKMIDIKINLVDQMPKWTVTCRNMVWGDKTNWILNVLPSRNRRLALTLQFIVLAALGTRHTADRVGDNSFTLEFRLSGYL